MTIFLIVCLFLLLSRFFLLSLLLVISQLLGKDPSTVFRKGIFEDFQYLWFLITYMCGDLSYAMYISIYCLCIFIEMERSPCMK